MKASQRARFRIAVNLAMDGGLAAAAALIARWIADPAGGWLHPLWFLAGGFITILLAGLPFRLPQQYWRFAGLYDLIGVVGGAIVSALLFAGLFWLSGYKLPTPTFPIVHALTLTALLTGPRVAWRLSARRRRGQGVVERVLLVGADDAADALLQALARDPAPDMEVVGLLALSSRQTGRRIHGLPILGPVEDAAAVLDRLARRGIAVDGLVITAPDFLGEGLAALAAVAQPRGLKLQRARRGTLRADAERPELRDVAIEDLLNRPQIGLDRAGLAALIAGRRVLLTGAGGSIGGEIARQVAALNPAELVLLDHGEFALWQIDTEISERAPSLPRRAVIADVRDARAIGAICAQCRPEIVFHAAALKHVPMVEANPIEGLLTNAVGSRIVHDAAAAAGAAAMVLISTDKAVNPTSLMGASKRLAEMYGQACDIAARAAAAAGQPAMRVVTVRFGNVLGSTGSVIPLFRRQLERGGPLTVTHPDMQRYFMTVGEAVSLVLEAASVAVRGAALPDIAGGIFVLDMGKPVKIVDLARQMIRLAGLRPDRDVKIHFTGTRPGEKLFEELFHGAEPPVATGFSGLLMAAPRVVERAAITAALAQIEADCRAGDAAAAIAQMRLMVPEYQDTQARPAQQAAD